MTNTWNKKNFYQWLIGFMDAEGNFQTTKVKRVNTKGDITHYTLQYSVHLSLHIRDRILIEYIQKRLDKKGIIYYYEKRNDVHLSIAKNKDIIWLIENLFDRYNLLTKHQLTRLEQIKFGLRNNIKRINNLDEFVNVKVDDVIPDLKNIELQFWENWLGGFINGEASFSYASKGTNKKIPRFFLEHTDEKIMYYIRDYFQFGPNVFIRTRDIRQTTYSLNITSKKDLISLVTYLDSKDVLLGYKKYQYENWKKRI